MDEQPQDDLTNLNWVAGISVPINSSVSPPKHTNSTRSNFKGITDSSCKPKKDTRRSSSQNGINVDQYGNKKPNCSYSCLIAMALRAAANSSLGGCLPVQEIYRCIENLFPFYKNSPDGWKNSVRHNLSLGTTFRKVLRNEGWQGKKGYFWEISPSYNESIDKEVEIFLAHEGLSSEVLKGLPSVSTPTKLNELSRKTPTFGSTVTPKKKTPRGKSSKENNIEELPDPEIAMFSPQMQAQLKANKTPATPVTVPTLEVFDTSSTPSQFVGIQTPQSDDIGAARELFGNEPTTDHLSRSSSSPTVSPNKELLPITTTPSYNMYGIPTMMMGYVESPSPIMGISPTSSEGTPPGVISPPCFPFVPMSMFPSMFMPPYCMGPHPQQGVYPIYQARYQNGTDEVFESENPLDGKQRLSSTTNSCTKKRKKLSTTSCHSRKKAKTSVCSRRLQFKEDEDKSSDARSPPPPSPNDKNPSECFEDNTTLLPIDTEHSEKGEEEIHDTMARDEVKAHAYAAPLIDLHGLSREKIRELEEIVGSTAELDSIFSSAQNSLYTSPDTSFEFETTHTSEVVSKESSSIMGVGESIDVVSSALTRDSEENSTVERVPEVSSLISIVEASVVNLKEAVHEGIVVDERTSSVYSGCV